MEVHINPFGAKSNLSSPLFVPAFTPSYATQPGLGEIVAARDITLLLEKLIGLTMMDCSACCGALFFAGPPPIRIRRGQWSDPALRRLLTWERIIANELQRHPMHVVTTPSPGETRLHDDPIDLLVNAPLLAGAEVVGSLTLAFSPDSPPPENYATLVSHAAYGIHTGPHPIVKRHDWDCNQHPQRRRGFIDAD